MSEITEWVDELPDDPRGQTRTARILKELQANPGRWAKNPASNSLCTRLKNQYPGHVEVTKRGTDYYIRWVESK